MDMGETEKYLTGPQLAEKLGVHPETIRRWTRRGAIPFLRAIRARPRYKLSEVVAVLEAEKSSPPA